MEVVGKIRHSKLCSDWILEGLAQSDASTTEEQAGRLVFWMVMGPQESKIQQPVMQLVD